MGLEINKNRLGRIIVKLPDCLLIKIRKELPQIKEKDITYESNLQIYYEKSQDFIIFLPSSDVGQSLLFSESIRDEIMTNNQLGKNNLLLLEDGNVKFGHLYTKDLFSEKAKHSFATLAGKVNYK